MGLNVILDTNAIIDFLQGDYDTVRFVKDSEKIGISVISKLEFLAFDGLTEKDKIIFYKFCDRVHQYDLSHNDQHLHNLIIEVRKKYKLKLPDSIIAATAMINDAVLLTKDKEFSKIKELIVHN
jgi:predicted nucleic acid-binding protein